MKEVLRTNNPVEISWCRSLLNGAGIESIHLDAHTSVLEGSISAIQQRLMVADEDFEEAADIIRDAKRHV